MTWTEIFSRTGTFLTVLSANAVALSLVAGATGFDTAFTTFALTMLPVVLLVGVATFVRLVEADIEDAWLVIGMNRIRHAYIELVPRLEPYLVAGHHDDPPGLLQTYSFRQRVGMSHWLSGSPVIVGVIDAVVAGVTAGITCQASGAGPGLRTALAMIVGLVTAACLGTVGWRRVRRVSGHYRPRFPAPPAGPGPGSPVV